MISLDNTKKLVRRVLNHTSKEAQVIITGGKSQLARIGKNEVYQNILGKEYSVKVQVADGKKVGNSSCNRFDGDQLKQTVERAELISSHQDNDPNWPGFYSSNESIIDQKFYSQKTVDACFEDKLSKLAEIFDDAKSRGVEIAGAFSHGDQMKAIGNSKNCFHYHAHTDASFTFSIMTPKGGTGWAEFHSHELEDINPVRLYEIALEKALASESPEAITEGEYTVILEPPAVASLMRFLGYLGFGGMSFIEGRSYFSNKQGQKLFNEKISITDNAFHSESFGCPFDLEGQKRNCVELMNKGVFVQPVLDTVTAKKLGGTFSSTGHALAYPSASGPLPLNLALSPGDSDVETMIRETKRGILVTRFFYDNVIDPGKLSLTGMTRDGTFLIKDGKVVNGLKNLRYNETIPQIFNNVVSLSKQTWSLRGMGRTSVPAMKVDGFKFNGVGE